MDWSSNHAAMPRDARVLTNMRVTYRGMRKCGGEDGAAATQEDMPAFAPYEIEKGDIGHNVPKAWKAKIKVGEPFDFKFKGREKPFYKFSNKAVGGEWKGKAIGKR